MSGASTNNKISRKTFIAQLASLTLLPLACGINQHKITGRILGGNSTSGHRLRKNLSDDVQVSSHKKVVIVGGGISGLTAAAKLKENGIDDFVLLELHEQAGGNSLGGSNSVSAYPWGAHYLPIPDHRDEELVGFLKSCGVVTGFDISGLPIYNEEYLCFDPEERLFINGYWQEGLIPNFGVPNEQKKEIERFLQLMDKYRNAKGSDGKDAFCIPIKNASKDEQFKRLDDTTFATFLGKNHFFSPYLVWYLNYCVKDDFGATIDKVSAWAGIHYFASRKGKASNAHYDTVLTWPEGNFWLVNQLQKNIKDKIQTNALTYSVKPTGNGKVKVSYLLNEKSVAISADYVIMATPQFINKKIIDERLMPHKLLVSNYMPWLVANISVNLYYEATKGLPLSWDNVIYDAKGLGYVHAKHQMLSQSPDKTVFTFYYPLCEKNASDERKMASEKPHDQWVELIVDELEKAHPTIRKYIENIDVWIWGHGMILPEPGYQKQLNKVKALTQRNVYFAHTDLSGISIFEEAFHQGIDAAKNIINNEKVGHKIQTSL